MMDKRAIFVGAGVITIGLAAYGLGAKKADARAPAPAPLAPPTVAATTPPPRPTAERGPFDVSGLDGLGARLAAEKASAGRAEPSASAVFAAIQGSAKIPLADEMQPLAMTIGASYCARMATKHDVYVVVCEYGSEEAAKAGQKKATNDIVKRREVLQKRSATCAVHQVGESKEAADEARRIKDVFRSI